MSPSALLVITNDCARKPILLERVMGAELLTWLSYALAERGISRFFLLCQASDALAASRCFPPFVSLTVCPHHDASAALFEFLSGADERLLVITQPCMLLPAAAQPISAQEVSTRALMGALDAPEFSFRSFLSAHAQPAGRFPALCPVPDRQTLHALAGDIMRAHLAGFRDRGVELVDERSCHIGPGVRIGEGSVLLPGCVLRGDTVIGADCVIGPNAVLQNAVIGSGSHIAGAQICECSLGAECAVDSFCVLRRSCRLGRRVRVDASSVLHAVTLGDGTHVGAGCVLHSLTAGCFCRLGPGCLTALCAPDPPGSITLGDNAVLGAGVTLTAAAALGRSAAAAARVLLTEPVPPQALVYSRSKPSLRKDWALH